MSAPSEDSDQPVHSRCLIRTSLGTFLIAKGARFPHADNEDSDQTARMRRLIFVGSICQKVRFLSFKLRVIRSRISSPLDTYPPKLKSNGIQKQFVVYI